MRYLIFIALITFAVSFTGMYFLSFQSTESTASQPKPTVTDQTVIPQPPTGAQATIDVPRRRWKIQSIDTMKQSRDIARQTLTDVKLQKSIDIQMSNIEKTGATHVGIGTPYDAEFIPVLKLWVNSARRHNLKVFFRGNFSGWEKWFGYKKIGREEHMNKTKEFIENNSQLFEDGDLFSSCPECENGEKLDRSNPAQINEYKAFLIKEYQLTKASFKNINKKVDSNHYSMNGDMAFLMMDKTTTASFDGIVSIDHYVKDTARLEKDIKLLAQKSGGKIVLGEFGTPIPNIHGRMSEEQQKAWIEDALSKIAKIPEVHGINYWVNEGGSTAIYTDSHQPKKAVSVISDFFHANR